MYLSEQQRLAATLIRLDLLIHSLASVEENWKLDIELFNAQEQALSDISDIGTGSTPSRTDSSYFGGDIRWVLTAEVNECDVEETNETLTEQAIRDYRLRIYPPDTILIAMYGQGATRGKAAYLRIPAAITQNCAGIVVTSPEVLPRYLYYYLRSIYEEIRGQEYSGAGVPHLNLSIIGSLRVPIPSLEEQGAVIEKLDAQVKLMDDLRTMRTEAEAKVRKILDNIWES